MNPAQIAAWTAATSNTPAAAYLVFASILAVLMFIWAAWIVKQTLTSLIHGESATLDLLFAGLRVSALIWFVLYIVR